MPGLCVSVEKYTCDGRGYLGSKYSSRWKPSSSTTDIGWASKTVNSKTLCVIANAFKLSIGNFSRRWSASHKVSCWAVLSPAPLVLLSCRNAACSIAWCFWMCLTKLVVLYFAVLPAPLKTFTLQTLQTAVELVGVACSSSMRHTRAADKWHSNRGGKKTGLALGSVNFSNPWSNYFVSIGAEIRF